MSCKQDNKSSSHGEKTHYKANIPREHDYFHGEFESQYMPIDPLTLLSYGYRIDIDQRCCDVPVAQINYPNLNKQDSIEKARSQSYEKVLVQIFMLYDIQLGGFEVIYVMLQ